MYDIRRASCLVMGHLDKHIFPPCRRYIVPCPITDTGRCSDHKQGNTFKETPQRPSTLASVRVFVTAKECCSYDVASTPDQPVTL